MGLLPYNLYQKMQKKVNYCIAPLLRYTQVSPEGIRKNVDVS